MSEEAQQSNLGAGACMVVERLHEISERLRTIPTPFARVEHVVATCARAGAQLEPKRGRPGPITQLCQRIHEGIHQAYYEPTTGDLVLWGKDVPNPIRVPLWMFDGAIEQAERSWGTKLFPKVSEKPGRVMVEPLGISLA